MRTQSQVVSAQALSAPMLIQDILPQSLQYTGTLLPGILVFLSPGASLTYNVEVTGLPNPVNAAGEPWNVADNGGGLAANVNLTIVGAVMAVRLNVLTYVSGSATMFLIQP